MCRIRSPQGASFVRRNEHDKVFAVLNFSNTSQTVTFHETLFHGTYTELFAKEPVELLADC